MNFWNWKEGEDGSRELVMDGPIASETWWGDEVTPALFRDQLHAGNGPVTVWINSPGGDCFAASRIYTMLKEYPGEVTVKIDGMAASAATVIAMGGDRVLMSPTANFFIHNPSTMAWGEAEDMRQAQQMLDEVKQSIINAYEMKTGLSRTVISHLMDDQTMMNAKKAKELGFIDEILYLEGAPDAGAQDFSMLAPVNSLMEKIRNSKPKPEPIPDGSVKYTDLMDRLLAR